MDFIYIYKIQENYHVDSVASIILGKKKKKSLFHLPVCALEKNIHTSRIDPALPFEGETIVLSGLFRLLGYRRM